MGLLRRSHTRRHPTEPGPDERIWGRGYHGMRPWVFGLIIVLIIAVLSVLAYTKELPFTDDGYQLHATFENATTLRADSPVRIAGVNVGEVTDVQPKGDAAEVTFTVKDEGLPIHEDAEITIRPRLFLEGNFFLELRPGSPSAPELPSGGDIPSTQTNVAVQLDEVLTSLQSDSRRNLQKLLEGYGNALTYQPTAADDATQEQSVQGETASESINDTFKYGGAAGKNTTIVNDALLGQNPHDLSALIAAQRDFFRQLADREAQLRDLITNFNTFTGALADESANLTATFNELAPTLEAAQPSLRELNAALPPLRAWARILEPNIRPLPETIQAGLPWLEQTRLLLRDRELGSLAKLLGDTAPHLAKTTESSRRLFPELTLTNRCAADVLEPTGNIPITVDPNDPDGPANNPPNFHEFFYGFVNQAGEGQSFDGNGSYLRVQAGGGPQLVKLTNPDPSFLNTLLWGKTIEDPIGTQPRLPTTGLPPFRMDVPCHKNALPNLNGPQGAVGPPSPEAVGP